MRRRLAGLGILFLLPAPVVPYPAVAAPMTDIVRFVPEDTGKYYVVGPPDGGQQEFLFAIAANTLRDGNRAEEIFALNQGRLQPDGDRMTDPTTVKPGWILVLPADATGAGVHTGALPEVQQTPGPEQTGLAETAGAGSPSTEASGSGLLWSPAALRVALVVLTVLALAWAWPALRSRRRAARRPAVVPAGAPATPVTTPAIRREAPAAAPARLVPRPPAATGAVSPSSRFENYDGPAETSLLSAIALPRPGGAADDLMPAPPGPSGSLVTDLICGGRPATVRLIGARPGRWGSAHGWLAEGETPPPFSAPVVLGAHQGRRLWIDLTVAPDVLVLGGDERAARAHGLDLAGQLSAHAEVVIAGEVLGDAVPHGTRRIESVAELSIDLPAAATRILICDADGARAFFTRLRTMPASRGHTVPVVIGTAPAARWSVQLRDTSPSAPAPAQPRAS